MRSTGELPEHTLEVFCGSRNDPWFPEMTRQLVRLGEERHLRPKCLSLESYGTARFLKRKPGAKRNIHVLNVTAERCIALEVLERDLEKRYEKAGLSFADPSPRILAKVLDAFELLKRIPTLCETVVELVRVIHILDSLDDSYDLSHSDPDLPFSVFVSVPQANEVVTSVRLMESVVHEAMHLQLTLIDDLVSLCHDSEAMIFSPWRSDPRPAIGVLHGLYVFTNIARAYQIMLSMRLKPCEMNFIENRLDCIMAELKVAHASLRTQYLTDSGRSLVARLLSVWQR